LKAHAWLQEELTGKGSAVFLHFTGKTEIWSLGQGIIAEDGSHGNGIWEKLDLKMGFFLLPTIPTPFSTL